MAINNKDLFKEWRATGLTKKNFWLKYYADKMTYSAFVGRSWRAERDMNNAADLYNPPLPEFPILDWQTAVIIGDVQIPTTDYDFAALPMAIADRYIKKQPRYCVIAGDFINADGFSGYEPDAPEVAFDEEIEAARSFIHEYLQVFDRIFWFMGNHERRVTRRTKAQIMPHHMRRMITNSDRVQVSNWGACILKTPQGPYRVTHARAYSVQQLNVADILAQKYQMHIISHHEHHAAKGFDRYGRYVVVNNGGLFRQSSMAYAILDDSKSPVMKPGFTLLRDGYTDLLCEEPFTRWDEWLPEKKGK